MSFEPLIPDWDAPAWVRAACTTRSGGVSTGPFQSLNVGAHVGDSPAAVAENRARVRGELGLPTEPLWLRQIHGNRVLQLGRPKAHNETLPRALPQESCDPAGRPGRQPPESSASESEPMLEADAAVMFEDDGTPQPRVCAIQVADCLPVLLADRGTRVVGAAHAGWKGLLAGVLEATLAVMSVRPSNLVAWLGPAIAQDEFEVGAEVRAQFVARDAAAERCFVPNSRGRWQCDLYGLARQRLAAAGVQAVFGGEWSTCADATRFFSYRRDGRCGRMAALIWVED